MPHINNIFNIRINNVSSNGSVNFGNVIMKGNSANAKSVGGQSVTGDLIASPANHNFSKNIMNDPDVIDQPQTTI
jgi:hypothetical protein